MTEQDHNIENEMFEAMGPGTSPAPKPDPIEDQLARIQRSLDGLRAGLTVTVARVRPTWCKGWLERIDVIEGEPVDMDYLSRTWGGEVLRLRVCNEKGDYKAGADVPLYSWPCRHRGRLLEAPNEEPLPYNTGKTAEQAATPVPQGNGFGQLETMLKTMSHLSEQKKSDLVAFAKLLPQFTTPQTSGLGGLEQIGATLKMVKQIQTLFGGAPAGGPASVIPEDTDNFLPYLTDIIKTVMGPKQGQQGPPRQQRVVPPRPPGPQGAQGHPGPQGHAQPPLRPVAPPDDSTLEKVAEMIAGLPPDAAAEVVAAAFGKMPEEKRAVSSAHFMSIVGDEEGDEYEEGDDEGDDQDLDDDGQHDNNDLRRAEK